jgi:amino acid permease
MFSILNEIKISTHFRTTAVVVASIGSACSIYVLVAITGYLSYGSNVKGNIISMYPPAAASTIGRAAIVVLVMFSYPLQVHPCRASVDAVLKWRPIRRTNTTLPTTPSVSPTRGSSSKVDEISDVRFAALTTSIIVASYLVAMTVSSLEAVLAYVGSTGSTSISFILPGLFYYKISAPDSPAHQRLVKNDDLEDDDDDDVEDEETGEDADGEHNPLLSTSIASLQSLSRRAKILGKHVWPKDLLRKMSLALAIYGVVVMVVCLLTNAFMHASAQH